MYVWWNKLKDGFFREETLFLSTKLRNENKKPFGNTTKYLNNNLINYITHSIKVLCNVNK